MTDAERTGGTTVTAWLERLRATLPPGADRELTPGEMNALLELTRDAAHASERIAAPLTAFLVGAAYADLPDGAREARIRELTATLRNAGTEG